LTIDKIHTLLDFLLNKAEQGALTHAEKDMALNAAQRELFDELKPAYGASEQLHAYLRPFRKKLTLLNGNTTGGAIALPADFSHLLLIELNVVEGGTTVYKGVELVNDDKVSDRKNSQLIPADTYPFAYEDEQGLQLHPATAVAGTLRYLRKPADCLYAYTESGRTITYNSAGSTQLEWNDDATQKIICKALAHCGMNQKDINAINFSQAREAVSKA
jgi:hypothetical protein